MNQHNPYADLHPGSGPDGSSLLGFLSAVGALVSFTAIYPQKKVTLHWEESLGWRGRILIDGARPGDAEITKLHEHLTSESNKTRFELKKGQSNERYKTITKLEKSDAQSYLEKSIQETDRDKRERYCSSYSGWFSDIPTKKGFATSSKLCALTGAHQQDFLETALQLSGFHKKSDRKTSKDHLEATLIQPWKYGDTMPGCRWDSGEERLHSLRHRDPTKGDTRNDPHKQVRTQRGANRLGLEALSVFPLMPVTKRAETPCFSYVNEGVEVFTWPIWENPLALSSVRVLVGLPQLITKKPKLESLSPLGARAVFRVTRLVDDHGGVSFTISEPL